MKNKNNQPVVTSPVKSSSKPTTLEEIWGDSTSYCVKTKVTLKDAIEQFRATIPPHVTNPSHVSEFINSCVLPMMQIYSNIDLDVALGLLKVQDKMDYDEIVILFDHLIKVLEFLGLITRLSDLVNDLPTWKIIG
ncbi:MAG: hypothetical protein ACLQVY_00470 [Limisphaerales bacterium]